MLKAFLPCLLAIAIAAGALAQSQREPPRTPPGGQNAQPTAPDQRGTDQIPFTVKILPTQPPKEETEKAETEKTEKTTIDRKLAFETQRIADYTRDLTAITAFLFFIAVIQAGLFFWQLLLLRHGARDATVAADAAKLASEAAVEQAKLMGLQLDLVEKQHGVARHQFFAANRPRLIVHFVRRIIEHSDTPTDEQAIAVEFRLMNVGTSDASVSESRIAVARFIPGLWPHPDELVGEDLIPRPIENRRPFPVGTSNSFIARSTVSEGLIDRMEIEAEDRLIQLLEDSGAETSGRLYLIGWIVYEDRLQNPLTLYFCREYDRKTGRFTPARDCDWEERYD
jgi:hypothetical protein